ncbi:protein regulator of cytokinesis 1-like [Zophobas morio]|uniref:protein regulator of cytokinesis 1-like n=1 Tax=Zophobas morio TaxID=2755281 RepID=UPI003083C071
MSFADLSREFLRDYHLALRNLEDSWEALGIKEDEKNTQFIYIKEELLGILHEKVSWYNTRKHEIELEILDLERNIEKTVTLLAEDFHSSRIQSQVYGKKTSLIEKRDQLSRKHEELTKKYDERLVLKDKLLEEISTINSRLGLAQQRELFDAMHLSVNFINNAKNLLLGLQKEENLREAKLEQKIRLATELLDELELDPISIPSQLVEQIYSGAKNLPLTDEFLASVNFLIEELKEKKSQFISRIEQLSAQIGALWARLEDSSERANDVLKRHTKSSQKTVQALEDEIVRLTALRDEKMEVFIINIKNKLFLLYEECRVGSEQRLNFDSLTDNCEKLEAYEAEYERMSAYKTATSDLFTLIHKRETIIAELEALEIASRDPSRFNNRGGRLLQEQKQKQKLENSLPKITNKLEDEIQRFEVAKGGPFLVNGRPYRDLLLQNQFIFVENKENLVSAACETPQREQLVLRTPASSQQKKPSSLHNLTPFGSSATPYASLKRKLQYRTPGSKMSKLNPQDDSLL